MDYDVYYENEIVGKVSLQRWGLYYRIICKTRRISNEICRLYLYIEDKPVNLGVCYPQNGGLYLERKIAAKELSLADPHFVLMHEIRSQEGQFVPISPDRPFPMLWKVKSGVFQFRDGIAGIFMADPDPKP